MGIRCGIRLCLCCFRLDHLGSYTCGWKKYVTIKYYLVDNYGKEDVT